MHFTPSTFETPADFYRKGELAAITSQGPPAICKQCVMKLNLALSEVSVRMYGVDMIICFPLQLISKGSPQHKPGKRHHLFCGGAEEGKGGREIKLQLHCSL